MAANGNLPRGAAGESVIILTDEFILLLGADAGLGERLGTDLAKIGTIVLKRKRRKGAGQSLQGRVLLRSGFHLQTFATLCEPALALNGWNLIGVQHLGSPAIGQTLVA